jgi:SET domain-containing protein
VASRSNSDDLPFELRRSLIAGLGAFATRPIKKGTRIIEYTGERISNAEADRRYDEDKMTSHHTFLFTLNRQTVVDAAVGGNEARFINHSCAPNCEAVIEDGRRIYIEAIKDITVGEELVYDYQYERTDEHTATDERFYACRCGAPNCRGTILLPKTPRKKPASRSRARRVSQRR